MRKKWFLTTVILGITLFSTAQSFSINTDGSIADTSSILDVKSTAKGMLIPRMTKTQRNSIFQPATGLLIFQNGPDSTGFYFYNGSSWLWLISSATIQGADTIAWRRTGNTGTNPAVNFIGTTDNRVLNFRVNNTRAGSIDHINRNTSYGLQTLASNTGFFNVAIGDSALKNNTSASNLTAVGYASMKNNTLGLYNTAIGTESLMQNIVGTHNTAAGYLALRNNTASFNTGFGTLALYTNNIGIRNTGFGCSALYFTNANDNSALGYEALNQNFSGSWNVAIGSNAMRQNFSGSMNVASGDSSLMFNITGNSNVAIGKNALYSNQTGNYNTVIGMDAGRANITGSYLTMLGYASNAITTNLTNAAAIGANAKVGMSNAISIGDSTLGTTVGIGTAYPNKAGLVVNTTVGGNVHAMFGSNTTGMALESNWPGLGFNSYFTGGVRRYIGNGYAGNINIDQTNGTFYFFINGTGTAASAVSINKGFAFINGAGTGGALVPVFDNVYTLGSTVNRWVSVHAVNGTIQTSDAREKKNIAPLGYGLKQIMQLKPVSYQWKNKSAGEQVMLGLLAQDVKKILPEVIVENGGIYGMRSTDIIPVLVKAVQEQQQVIDRQQKLLEEMMKRLEQLEKR